MPKQNVYQKELLKLQEIFKDVEPAKQQLVEGLIKDAAFLYAENYALRQTLEQTGMVKVHPQHPDIQKSIEAARQYRQNVNSYAVIIKTLNGFLQKNIVDGGDEFDEFMKEMRGND